jgi:hypothetical protein
MIDVARTSNGEWTSHWAIARTSRRSFFVYEPPAQCEKITAADYCEREPGTSFGTWVCTLTLRRRASLAGLRLSARD